MPGHRDRPDDPGRPEQPGRPRPYSPADLRGRIGRLPETHPSSPEYRGGRGNRPVDLRKFEISDSRWSPDAGRTTGVADRSPPETRGSAWDGPGVADHPARPRPDTIRLTDDRKHHIFDGDAQGGGHSYGTGKPCKTEFPARWSDQATVENILDVTRRPDSAEYQKNGRWKVQGRRDDVDLVGVVRPDGQVWTAYPLPGGLGVTENPGGDNGRE